MTPAALSAAICSSLRPASRRTSCVCSPSVGALPDGGVCVGYFQAAAPERRDFGGEMSRTRVSSSRLDDAARAGWLYYIAGKTQDEIAAQMAISRQAAQRLVSLAVSERLIRVCLRIAWHSQD